LLKQDNLKTIMQLEIITPEEKVYSGEVDMVTLPGVDGSFQILNNHAPIISALGTGEIRILEVAGGKDTLHELSGKLVRSTSNDRELLLPISKGVIEMQNNKVIVLAD